MKNLSTLFLLVILQYSISLAQLSNDSFQFRDDMNIDYNLYVKRNDPISSASHKIVDVLKVGTNSSAYSLSISSDSMFINIKSSDNTLISGSFWYKTSTDSAIVFFEKLAMAADIFPGDCNKDNLVNHFDLFPIGLMLGQYGSPRNLSDTNIDFVVPKKAQNWFFGLRGINAKHADVDGNGIIDENDIIQYRRNIGKSKGNYLPVFSFASNDVKLVVTMPDTVVLGNSPTISMPIKIVSPTPLDAYGLGFSYTVRVNDPSVTAQSRFYPSTYRRSDVWDEFSTLHLTDTISYPEHINVVYCRRNQINGGMGDQAGIVDITIDEVLLGLPNPGSVNFINVYLKEVTLIDNYYNTISISPVSKRLYLQKASSSIQETNNIEDNINVFPTVIENEFMMSSDIASKKIEYSICDALGQIICQGNFQSKEIINTKSWASGFYFIRNSLNSQVKRLIKK